MKKTLNLTTKADVVGSGLEKKKNQFRFRQSLRVCYDSGRVKNIEKQPNWAHLRRCLLNRMTAIRATLAPTPRIPKVMRMMAEVWSSWLHSNVGRFKPVELSLSNGIMGPFRPGPTTTAIMSGKGCQAWDVVYPPGGLPGNRSTNASNDDDACIRSHDCGFSWNPLVMKSTHDQMVI